MLLVFEIVFFSLKILFKKIKKELSFSSSSMVRWGSDLWLNGILVLVMEFKLSSCDIIIWDRIL